MSVRAQPDKKLFNKKIWNMLKPSYNKIKGQLFSCNTFKWADARGTIKIRCNNKKLHLSAVEDVLWAILSNSFALVKMAVVRNRAKSTKNGPISNYHDGFESGDLENLHRHRFIKLDNFNKITEKIALTVVMAFLPTLDNFQIFAKVPLSSCKIQWEIH